MKDKKILEELGLKKNWIYEAIVTTYSGKKPHAAPMGILTRDLVNIEMEIYKTSETCVNIMDHKEFVINLSNDVSLFYKSLYEKGSLSFAASKEMNSPVLKEVDGYLYAIVTDALDLGDRIRFKCSIKNFQRKNRKNIPMINRADALAMECIIKATKIRNAAKAERESLKGEIRCIYQTISKVAPGSEAQRISQAIVSLL